MPEPQRLPHLKVDSFYQDKTYNYPKNVIVKFPLAPRNRALHGNALLQQLESIRQQFQIAEEEEIPTNIVRDDALYVEFHSEVGFPLKFDSLSQNRDKPQFQLLTVKEEIFQENGEERKRYRVAVMMRQGGVSEFIKKVTTYINENSKDRDGNLTDKPSYADLIANIASIQLQRWNHSGLTHLNWPSQSGTPLFGGKHGLGGLVTMAQSWRGSEVI